MWRRAWRKQPSPASTTSTWISSKRISPQAKGFYAIDQILRTAVRERFALPEFLVEEVRNVFPVGVVPAKEEARFRPAFNDAIRTL
jgi:hypothetical protein